MAVGTRSRSAGGDLDSGGHMVKPIRRLASVVVVAALVLAPMAAYAAISGRIVENVGVKTARLGMKDSTAALRIGRPYVRTVDRGYAALTYRYSFGKKIGGKYPLVMYSNSKHAVFNFQINTSAFRTSNGCAVGTTESALKRKYGTKLKRQSSPTYHWYWIGTRSGRTDFFVRSGKVHHIVIWRY